MLSVPLEVELLESSSASINGKKNLDCVGVHGEGVHECSLSCCLSMIPVRCTAASFVTTGECGDCDLTVAAVSLFTLCLYGPCPETVVDATPPATGW